MKKYAEEEKKKEIFVNLGKCLFRVSSYTNEYRLLFLVLMYHLTENIQVHSNEMFSQQKTQEDVAETKKLLANGFYCCQIMDGS